VVPLTLIGVAAHGIGAEPGAEVLLTGAVTVLGWCWPFLEKLAGAQWVVWTQNASPFWVLWLGVLGIALTLMPGGLPGRWLGLVFVMPMLVWPAPRPQMGAVWLTVLDVGQGLSVVVQTRTRVLVFDTGARFSTGLSLGDAVLVPYLRYQGIDKVDTLIVSHADNDHAGGAAALLASVRVEARVTSVPGELPRGTSCRRGQFWQWDDVQFHVLHPARDTMFSDNNASCVLRIVSPHGSVLIPGDIEADAEATLVQRDGAYLGSDVLVVPHHGSRSSSTDGFLDAVRPKLAVVSTGYRNRYGHPHSEIVDRYKVRGISLHNTVTSGAVMIKLDAKGQHASAYRDDPV